MEIPFIEKNNNKSATENIFIISSLSTYLYSIL